MSYIGVDSDPENKYSEEQRIFEANMREQKPWSRDNITFQSKYPEPDEMPNQLFDQKVPSPSVEPKTHTPQFTTPSPAPQSKPKWDREQRKEYFKNKYPKKSKSLKKPYYKKKNFNKPRDEMPHRTAPPEKKVIVDHYVDIPKDVNVEKHVTHAIESHNLPFYCSPHRARLLSYWFDAENGGAYHHNSFMENLIYSLNRRYDAKFEFDATRLPSEQSSAVHLYLTPTSVLDDCYATSKLILHVCPNICDVATELCTIKKIYADGVITYHVIFEDKSSSGHDFVAPALNLEPHEYAGVNYYYKTVRRFGPFEVGRYVCDPEEATRRYIAPTIIIKSNVLNDNGRKRTLASWLADTFLGAKQSYSDFTCEVPLSLYSKLVMHAMMVDVIDQKLFMEMKGVAARWRLDPNHYNLMDDQHFQTVLPHVILAACRESKPHYFGAVHYNYNNEMVNPKTNPLTNRRWSHVPLVFSYFYDALTYCFKPLSWVWSKVSALFSKDNTPEDKMVYHVSKCMYLPDANVVGGLTHMQALGRVPRADDRFYDEIKFTDKGGKEYHIPSFFCPAPKFSSRPITCSCRLQPVKRYYSYFLVEGVQYFDFCNCSSNLQSGLVQRYFKPTLVQDDAEWKLMAPYILESIRQFARVPLVVIDFDKWLSSRKYTLAKKALIETAKHSADVTRHDFDRSRIFTKSEMGIYLEGVDKFFKPRVIFEKSPYNLAEIGPWMATATDHVKKIWDGSDGILFACGYDRVALGRKVEEMLKDFKATHFSELDIVRCEAGMKARMIWVESEAYASMGLPSHVSDVLFGKKFAIGSDRSGQLSYKMSPVKESGTTNTTVGNTLVYGILMHACLRYKQETDKDFRYRFIVGGDDSVLMANKPFDDVLNRVRNLGIDLEITPRDSLEKCRFYSGRFIPMLVKKKQLAKISGDVKIREPHDLDDWAIQLVHVPLIAKAFVKGGTFKDHHLKNPDDFAASVLLNRKAEYDNIPILRQITAWGAQFLKPSTRRVKVKSNENLLWKTHDYQLECVTETFLSICRIYGITKNELQDLEVDISNQLKERAGVTIRNETLLSMLRVDLA